MFCSKCGNKLPDNSTVCDKCGNNELAQAQEVSESKQPQAAADQKPVAPQVIGMKWYKCLVYFVLFAVALLNIVGGIVILSGGSFIIGGNLSVDGKNLYELFYKLSPNLKTAATVYGIVCIVVGAFQIFVRFSLTSYKKKGPDHLLLVCALPAMAAVFYIYAVMNIIPYEMFRETDLLLLMIGCVVIGGGFAIFNKIYFNKRKHLFVN